MTMRETFFIIAVSFGALFSYIAWNDEKPTTKVKASDFNFYIKERNQGDERSSFYDKQSVRNIVKKGCFPIIPRDTNKNIEAVCSDSSKD